MADYLDWPGESGRFYRYFWTSSIAAKDLTELGGNYMFVKKTPTGWLPLYIGVADNFKSRLPGHERLAEAIKAGASHVMSRTNPGAQARLDEERDLIRRWNPMLNIHHRTTG